MAELDESVSASEEVDTLVEETLENTATVDDFDLDLELEEGAEGTITEVDVATASTETELFELELDEENTSVSLTEIEQAVVTEEGDFADDLGGDLGIDFDPDSESGDTVEISALPEDDDVVDELTGNGVEEEDFDFDDAADGANTKLDLARAYIDMGDQDGARDILNEVVEEGNDEQQKQATNLLDDL
jgi:pilus assembly protein FimV